MTLFSDTFYPARAGRYADPLNSNDRLPVVYGDLTDGTLGVWVLPCIDVADDVFCYAGHAVLSAANGNSVTIYEDDLELDPGMYVFDESDNYEGVGTISTITFSTPKTGSIITARGKGKADGATLIENIIDIVEDFLTVENDFTSADFDDTTKATVKALVTAQGYKAAGIIGYDAPIWTILTQMLSSFLGTVYADTEGKLVFDIDVNAIIRGTAAVIRKGDAYMDQARIRLVNLINQCPCNYAYSYRTHEFTGYADEAAHADSASQAIFGTRTPVNPYQLHWCRDLTSVQTVQDLIVEKLRAPLYELEVVVQSMKHPHLELGDIVMMTAERLYDPNGLELVNRYWKTVSVRPDYSAHQILLGLVDAGFFYTIAYLADGGELVLLTSGSVDREDMRLSLVDGNAFVAFEGMDLSDYEGVRTGYKLTVMDSADEEAIGYITDAGGGEALGSELVLNGGFEAGGTGGDFDGGAEIDDGADDTFTNWTGGGTGKKQAVSDAKNGSVALYLEKDSGKTTPFVYQDIDVTPGALYKVTFWTKGTGTVAGRYQLYDATNSVTYTANISTGVTAAVYAQVTHYVTIKADSIKLRFYAVQDQALAHAYFDDISIKEVTECAATGVHIVSAGSGATRNWTSIAAGFDYNDESGYTYKIQAGRLADGSVLAGNNRDTTVY